MLDIPVLIIGGGPVGLTASLLLSRQGIHSLLAERHPGTAVVPKARGINARTMEMYRQLGIEEAIRAAGLAVEKTGLIVWTESLAGTEIERRVPGRFDPKNMAATPTHNCLCAQDDFEPVLRRFAEAEPLATLRFSTEMTTVQYDADGVTGTLVDRVTGEETPFHAQYLLACDGAQSRVRRQVGARMLGREAVYDSVNILFHADLRPWTAHRPAALYFVEQPDLRGTFLTINAHDRWGFLIHSLSQYDFRPEDLTPERCVALIRQAVGVPDLEVSIRGVSAWEASAIVADRYRFGRVFLAGDAAHEMPPTGGFGMNTGVQDAQNLCWKLAAVLHGQAGDALLDSYHDERQPLGRLITETSLANSLSMGRTERVQGAKLARPEFLNEQGLIFGAEYESVAVVQDGSDAPVVADRVTQYAPSARPGHRAPHAWLERDGQRLSTIDLFGRGFVLLTGTTREAWRAAFAGLNIPGATAYSIGRELADLGDAWRSAYGLDADGAVLVRPDGHVAWRSRGGHEAPGQVLGAAVARLLGRAGYSRRSSNDAARSGLA